MGTAPEHTIADEVDSLLRWWRDVGVDAAIGEEPRNWLAAPAKAAGTAPPAEPVADAAPAATAELPGDLPAFRTWLASDTGTLADYPVRRRLPPEGASGAALMIVTDVPERGDSDAGRLLTGDVGALFDRMLAAMNIARGDIYLATLAPARPATGMIDDAELERLAPLLRQHIDLVAPARLWLMGRAASRAVLGMDELAAGGQLHTVNYSRARVAAIATLHPRVLLREPKGSKLRSAMWAEMQRLMGSTE